MILIRQFEETLLRLKGQGLVNGPVHTSVGQEAVAVGAASAVRSTDRFTGTHRAHHQYLAKVLTGCAPAGFDPLARRLTSAMYEAVRVLLCEVMGLADGCSGGRGGSMHLCRPAAGVAGTNAIVAGGVPHAVGVAWADRAQGHDRVTVCFLGDGAVYQGVTHESSNLAALWQAPVVFFVENNRYAVATSVGEGCSSDPIAQVALAYGMPGLQVDGMDPLAVKLAVAQVVSRRADGGLPCYVEADVYRYYHHAGDLPGSAYGYRDPKEEAVWQRRDPIRTCADRLRRLGILDDKGLARLERQAARCMAKAEAHCTETTSAGTICVRESAWPAESTLADGLRDDRLLQGKDAFLSEPDPSTVRSMVYSDAIAAVTGRWLEKDPGVVVLGEEVANFGGGAYGATKGLAERFPGRVRNTPISEAGFSGLACGAAMNNMHPIVEIMFSSFALVAADQLFNQIGQLGHIYGGAVSVPLVVRTRLAAGLGYGAQHSMDPTALFALFPGWRIFVPTTPFDYVGMFNAAMSSASPTVMIEHQVFYKERGPVPDGDLDYLVQPGKARVARPGTDVTVVAYGWAVKEACIVADGLAGEGIEAEVLDLRTVDDAGLDHDAIAVSVRKTGMLVTVEQAMSANSIGAKIVKECQARCFDSFDGAPVCVNGPDAPMPVSARLEQACSPSRGQIADAIRAAAQRRV